MFNFFKKPKKEKEKSYFKQDPSEFMNKKAIAEKEVFELNSKMFSKQCPLNNNKNCFAECVHFSPGTSDWQVGWPEMGVTGQFVANPPICRLWRKVSLT